MANMTYAQARSSASALVRQHHFGHGFFTKVLVYKDAGGNYTFKALENGINITYTSFKAIVYLNRNGEIITDVSRETIASILNEYDINFIYAKFG